MTITHTKNVNGWLPYGSDDPSILLQHPLTSDPAAYFATKGTTTVSGSGLQTFDPVKGMCPNGSGGYRIQSMAGYLDLDHAGQISYEIEREFVCRASPEYYSYGYIPTANECALSSDPTIGTDCYFGTKQTGAGAYNISHSAAVSSVYIASSGKDSFVRVNIGWSGGVAGGAVWYAINGQVIGVLTRNDAAQSGLLADIYIGSLVGGAGSYMAKHYMRNLQISSKAPMFASIPALQNIGMISDSMNRSDSVTSDSYRDALTSWTMRRELANRGLFVQTVTFSTEGGADLGGYTAGYIYTQLGPCLAKNPNIVIIRGGTNDSAAGKSGNAGWETIITQYITDCMAVPSVQIVLFLGIPSGMGKGPSYNNDTFKTYRAVSETKIQSACDAWRAANPTDPRKVIFANDIYERLGGENPPPGIFIGQVNGLYNDQHFSGYGHYIHGKAIADWIVSALM